MIPARAHGATTGRAPAVALWTVLALFALARAALAFVPAMWGWGLNLLRFLPPIPAWTLWAVAAIALVPVFARPLAPALASLGGLVLRAPAAAALLCGAALGLVLWALPDRAWFIGDFIVRNDAIASGKSFGDLFPENLPLDNLLHGALPRWLGRHAWAGADTGPRVLDALEGALFAMLAVGFARRAARERAGIAAAVAPFMHPQQGLARDWDVLAPAGVAGSMLAACLVAEVVAGAPWLGVAVTLAVLGSSGGWLLHDHDVERGLARAHALVSESPHRTDVERCRGPRRGPRSGAARARERIGARAAAAGGRGGTAARIVVRVPPAAPPRSSRSSGSSSRPATAGS